MELGINRFIKARYFTDASRKRGDIRVIVIHDMEAPEENTTAEAVARYFASGKVVASAHLNHDTDSTVKSVHREDVAYAAPGCNHDGLQHELAGYARQTRVQWLDSASRAVMNRAAFTVAYECKKYRIPIRHLTNEELAAGKRGIVGHNQVSNVYKKSSHWDPGPDFPWDVFMERVRYWYKKRFALPPKSDVPNKPTLRQGDRGPAVKELQRHLNYWNNKHPARMNAVTIDGIFGPATNRQVLVFQRIKNLHPDGIVGPATWRALLRR